MTHLIKTIVTGFILLFTTSNIYAQPTLTFDDVTTGTGSSFCMEVRAEGLTDLFGLDFSINWDESVLQFDAIQSVDPLFASANINTVGSSSGVATFSFFGGPITLPENDVFFEICFTVVGLSSTGFSDVEITGTPTSINVGTLGGTFTEINTIGGRVTLPAPLVLFMPDSIINPGTSFCIPVSVLNFDNLEVIQSAITWDPSVIQFDNVTNLNLSDLLPSSFGNTNAASGLITFSWNDDDGDPNAGVTVPDSTVIFEMCFTVVGEVNDMTTIVFSANDNPFVAAEVIQFGNSNNMGLLSLGGKINIQQTIFITNVDISEPNCADDEGGAINISVSGGTEPYTYNWSTMSTMQDVSGLGIGTYTVTITDSSNPMSEFTRGFSLDGDFAAPVADAGGIDTISCDEPTTILNGSGSTGNNLKYEWTHQEGTANILNGNTSMPTVDAVGIYNLLVTDSLNGCFDQSVMLVEGDNVPPTVNAGDAATLDCGTPVLELNGTVSPVGSYTFAWTSPTGATILSGANTLTPEVDEEGTYELLVTEMGSNCSATAQVIISINDATPIADAGNPMSINCGNSVVTLDGTATTTGNNIIYTWDGPGTITNGNSLTPTVDAMGTYTLTATNTVSECSTTSTVMVTESLNVPTAVVAPMSGEINCTTNEIILDGTGSSTGGNITYLWTSMDGNIASDATTLNPTVTMGGTYILIVTDENSTCTATDTTLVTQDASVPVADAGQDRTLNCEVTSVTLDGSDSSLGAQYKYLWSSNSGVPITDPTSIAPMVDAGGVYTLQVRDTINNCISTATVTVEMDTLSPIIDLEIPDELTCSQPKVALLGGVTSAGNTSFFNWSGLGICGVTNSGDIVVNAPGVYKMVLTNFVNQCKDSTLVTVTQNITEPTADAGMEFDLDCDQPTATLDGSNSSTGTSFIYQWTANSGNAPTNETTLTPTISSPGEYLLIVTDTLNGCMEMDSVQVGQSDNYPIVEAGADGEITCYDPQITLDASLVSSSGPDFSIQWVAMSGSGIVSDENTLTPVVNEPGVYELTITNINTNCSATDDVLVLSNNTPPISMIAADTTAFDCPDTLLVLEGTGSTTSGVEYLWKTNDGFIFEDADSLNATIRRGGTYFLCVTNPDNGCMAADTVFVEPLEPAPTFVVEVPSNLTCYFPTVVIDASASTLLANQVFNWNGPSIIAGENTLMPEVDAAGFYSLIVTDTITGCIHGTGALIFTDTSSVMVSATADGNIDCENNLVNLEANYIVTDSTDIVFGWSSMPGNIISADSNQLMIQVDAGGMYQFVATDTLRGCSDTILVEVMTNTTNPMADAGMTMELPCDVNSIFLDGSASSQGNDFVYLWTTSDGNIVGGETTLMPEINAPGTYDLLVSDTTSSCTAIAQVEITASQVVLAVVTTPVVLECGVLSVGLDGTGSSTGGTITYLWSTTDGEIDSGETTLMPQVSETGTYILTVSDSQSGCDATATTEVIFDNSFPLANAGNDVSVCENTTDLAANDAPANATGLWLSLGSAVPTDPANATTAVTNLQVGENIFVWTLSALGCPEYSSDTVSILLENEVQATNDTYVMQENEVLDFNVGTNDVFGAAQFQTLSSVMNGVLLDNGSGSFTYTPNLDFVGSESFDYEICSDACPDICDVANVSITVNVEEVLPIDSLIQQGNNAITPNEDGLNDNFVFDILLQYPDEFPNNEFIVFNRWGNIVYEAKPYNNDWNGTNNNNKPLPEETYYYILRLDFGAGLIMKGDVTILR